MSLRDLVMRFRCVMLRYNPIRHPVGLLKSGNPDERSPVLVSGNYYHTVRRLQRAVEGIDCHILVADSAGINVWCAAGVCDFNEHKIADAVHATGLAGKVSHRRLILPQLAAVGIDLSVLRKESGFSGVWGPASLDDIATYLDAGAKAAESMRIVRFPFADRLYNAIGMFNIFLVIPLAALLLWGAVWAHLFLLFNFALIFGSFLLYHALPLKYPSNNVVLIGIALALFTAAHAVLYRPVDFTTLCLRLLALSFVTLLVAIDMLGSTPYYKTTILHWFTTRNNESLFQPKVYDNCIACARCVNVCPKGVFSVHDGKAVADLSRACCECLACVKQCPVTAIVNRNGRNFKDDIKSLPDIERIMK